MNINSKFKIIANKTLSFVILMFTLIMLYTTTIKTYKSLRIQQIYCLTTITEKLLF